jgi:hypothetical protein
MNARTNNAHQRSSTRFSKDGCTVFVRLRVDRRDYEFARSWAAFHSEADPSGTAEEQLEGYLNMALLSHMQDMGWIAPKQIEELYSRSEYYEKPDHDVDDGIPL